MFRKMFIDLPRARRADNDIDASALERQFRIKPQEKLVTAMLRSKRVRDRVERIPRKSTCVKSDGASVNIGRHRNIVSRQVFLLNAFKHFSLKCDQPDRRSTGVLTNYPVDEFVITIPSDLCCIHLIIRESPTYSITIPGHTLQNFWHSVHNSRH